MQTDHEVELALHHAYRVIKERVPQNRQKVIALERLEEVGFRVSMSFGIEPHTGQVKRSA